KSRRGTQPSEWIRRACANRPRRGGSPVRNPRVFQRRRQSRRRPAQGPRNGPDCAAALKHGPPAARRRATLRDRLPMHKLNSRFVLVLVAVLLLLAAGTAVAHQLQTSRIGQALLWQADKAEKEDHPDLAAKHLAR